MTDAPYGWKRMDNGVLTFAHTMALRRASHDEAVWFSDGHGDRFGCVHRIYSGFHGHYCGKTARHDPDARGNPRHCGLHSEAAKAKRKATSDAKYAAAEAARKRANAARAHQATAAGVIRQVADGHNDPRTLCAEWIARMNALKAAEE